MLLRDLRKGLADVLVAGQLAVQAALQLHQLVVAAELELDDELVCVGGLGRRLDLGVGDLAIDAVGDVVADAGGKQDGFLICRQFLK